MFIYKEFSPIGDLRRGYELKTKEKRSKKDSAAGLMAVWLVVAVANLAALTSTFCALTLALKTAALAVCAGKTTVGTAFLEGDALRVLAQACSPKKT